MTKHLKMLVLKLLYRMSDNLLIKTLSGYVNEKQYMERVLLIKFKNIYIVVQVKEISMWYKIGPVISWNLSISKNI